jgi:hypothetical protein
MSQPSCERPVKSVHRPNHNCPANDGKGRSKQRSPSRIERPLPGWKRRLNVRARSGRMTLHGRFREFANGRFVAL